MYDSLALVPGLDLRGLLGPNTSSPSVTSLSRGIEIVASSANVELLVGAPGPENSGAGGKGLLGLPPYREDGVPGLGLPSISGGSYCRFTGGGLVNSLDLLDGLHDRVGDILPLDEYGAYEASLGASGGAESIIEGAREWEVDTEGW